MLQSAPAASPPVQLRAASPPPALPSVAPQPEAQLATTLGQAETAFSAQRYDEALRHYDDVLRLDPSNEKAKAGRARAQWVISSSQKKLSLGRMINEPAQSGKGPKGFESEDVDVKSQDFLCDLAIEVSPPAVRPPYDYTARVTLTNSGKKTIKIRSLEAKLKLNGAESSQDIAPLVKEVGTGQSKPLGEARGAWQELMNSWTLEVVVTGEKNDRCRRIVSWR